MPLTGRGGLVVTDLHGRSLHEHAVGALRGLVDEVCLVGSAPVGTSRVVHPAAWWAEVRADGGSAVLVHDPLCPLTPVDFLARMAARADEGRSLAAYRPVTDTVKTAVDGIVGDTLDRESLAALASPVLLSRAVVAAAVADDDPPPLDDVRRLVGWARARGPVEMVLAPSLARRVDDESAVRLLECVDELGHQVRAR